MDRKGARPEALRVAAAAQPNKGCLYIYDGYPSLYMLTHSCLPSRWAFPGHLSAQDEGSVRALGVDPAAEVRRIMAARPDAVVDDYPRFVFGNKATHAIVQQELNRSYYLAACVPNGFLDRWACIVRLRPTSRHSARLLSCANGLVALAFEALDERAHNPRRRNTRSNPARPTD
jgi:hypothetical protein